VIWAYLVAMRNISENDSDYFGYFLLHLFSDSDIASIVKMYWPKVQKIAKLVLQPFVCNACGKYIKQVCTLLVDGLREISNKITPSLMLKKVKFGELYMI